MKHVELVYRELNLRNVKNVTLLVLYAIVAFYFLINGSSVFSEWNSSWTWSTIIYMLGVSIFLGIQERLPEELESSLLHSAIGFLASFLLVTSLFLILYDAGILFTDVNPMPLKAIPATIIYQLVVVVCSEEIIFRGVIFRFLYQFHWLVAVFGSAVLFSLFHLAVYEGSLGALSTAFLMGIILAWCVKRWNLGVAIGIHAAWNLFVLGVTVLA